MATLYPGASLPAIMGLLQPEFPVTGMAPLPGLSLVQSYAATMLPESPVIAIRRGDEVALIPQSLTPGAKAAIIPLAASEKSREISLTSDMAAQLKNHLEAGNIGSAHDALTLFFDDSGKHSADAPPAYDKFVQANPGVINHLDQAKIQSDGSPLEQSPIEDPHLFKGKKIAILASHGVEVSELAFPLQYLKERGAAVDILVPGWIMQNVKDGKEPGVILSDFYKNVLTAIPSGSFKDGMNKAYDLIVVTGGAWNSQVVKMDGDALKLVADQLKSGGLLAAICAGTEVLIHAGLAKGTRLTGPDPSVMNLANAGAIVANEAAVITGNLLTGRDPSALHEFVAGIKELLTRPKELPSKTQVDKFFSNYALIGDWSAFQAEQTKLLSPEMTTVVSDHLGVKTYDAPKGYFDSLGDWSKSFSTGPDFRVEIQKVTATQVVARLHGKILFKQPIQGVNEVSDDQHAWTETFTISANGLISQVEVAMNLFKSAPSAK